MRLTDIMSFLDLHVWAEVALIIFAVVFIAVSLRVLLAPKALTHRIASIPLDDDDDKSVIDGEAK
ncbi:MAG: hypothetical protein Phyf2KO_13530 [Phycisphaerales bacterium]